METALIIAEPIRELPGIFPGSDTPQIRKRVEQFYLSVSAMFDTWIARSKNRHTQRSYRGAVRHFITFMGFRWPDEDYRLVRDVSVQDVQAWRNQLSDNGPRPVPSITASPPSVGSIRSCNTKRLNSDCRFSSRIQPIRISSLAPARKHAVR